jgi:hypothetical protein
MLKKSAAELTKPPETGRKSRGSDYNLQEVLDETARTQERGVERR